MFTLTDEYRTVAKLFKTTFGYAVPLSMIPQTTTTEELINRINNCIKENKDTLLESFGVFEEDNVLY